MAKYIKQEMPDLNGTGEKKCYYRLAKSRKISTKEFLNIIARHEMLNVGMLEHALCGIADNLAELLAEGYSVKLDGIGTFQATLGVKETKEIDTIDGDEQKRNAKSIEVQNAPDHKQRTLEPPVLRWRTCRHRVLRCLVHTLRAEGSESVPAVVCAFCATSLVESCVALNVQWAFIQRLL